jgi:hypothetical protein
VRDRKASEEAKVAATENGTMSGPLVGTTRSSETKGSPVRRKSDSPSLREVSRMRFWVLFLDVFVW